MSKELVTLPTVTDKELTMHLENLGLLKDLSDGEKNTYLQIAKAYNLNPFKREVHVSKFNGQMSIITGYEVYIKRAERSGQLDGWEAKTTGTIKGGDLKAIVTIHRKDRKFPFIWEALYTECVQKTKEGNPTRFWQKAEFMTKKVAISQAFRLCFSDELGGMPYTADEMGVEDVESIATTGTPGTGEKVTISKWAATPEQWEEANNLLATANLDDNRKASATNQLANAINATTWNSLIESLRKVQPSA